MPPTHLLDLSSQFSPIPAPPSATPISDYGSSILLAAWDKIKKSLLSLSQDTTRVQITLCSTSVWLHDPHPGPTAIISPPGIIHWAPSPTSTHEDSVLHQQPSRVQLKYRTVMLQESSYSQRTSLSFIYMECPKRTIL